MKKSKKTRSTVKKEFQKRNNNLVPKILRSVLFIACIAFCYAWYENAEAKENEIAFSDEVAACHVIGIPNTDNVTTIESTTEETAVEVVSEEEEAEAIDEVCENESVSAEIVPIVLTEKTLEVEMISEEASISDMPAEASYPGSKIETISSEILEDEEDVPFVMKDRSDIVLTEEEFKVLANVVFYESNAEPFQGQIAAAAVVLNRMQDETDEFPDDLVGVIVEEGQFETAHAADLSNGYSGTAENEEAVRLALEGYDYSCDAVFFSNPDKVKNQDFLNWFNAMETTTTIGSHVFKKP